MVIIDDVVVYVGFFVMMVLCVINGYVGVCDDNCECVMCSVCEFDYWFNLVVSVLVVV